MPASMPIGKTIEKLPKPFCSGELAHGGVRAGEADRGDDHGAGDDDADENAVHACQLHCGHPRLPSRLR